MNMFFLLVDFAVPPLNLGDTERSDRTEDDSDEEDTEGDDSFFDSKVPLTGKVQRFVQFCGQYDGLLMILLLHLFC